MDKFGMIVLGWLTYLFESTSPLWFVTNAVIVLDEILLNSVITVGQA